MRSCAAVTALAAAIALQGCGGGSSSKAPPPAGFSSPWPWMDASHIATSLTLSWRFAGGNGAPTFDVYLSASPTPTDLVVTASYATTVARSGLAGSTAYRWKVVARSGSAVVAESPTWSFTTGSGVTAPDLVPVAGGSFLAGDGVRVTVSSFQMDRYETTYERWVEVQQWGAANGYGDLPGSGTAWNGYGAVEPSNPVNHVSWYDAVKWCNARSEKDGLEPVYFTDAAHATPFRTGSGVGLVTNDTAKWSAAGYRLPTEVEWAYAAGGGAVGHGYRYPGGDLPENVGWYAPLAGGRTHAVGGRSANELGLYDLGGNVSEILWDWFDASYPTGGTTDPRGPATGTYKVVRGGSFLGADVSMDLWGRGYNADGPSYRNFADGVRTVRR